jgi:beta-glucosidase
MDENKSKKLLPYQDPSLSLQERVNDLLSRMNIEEKIAQLTSEYGRDFIQVNKELNNDLLEKLLKEGIGQITRIGGSTTLTPEEIVKITNKIQKFLVENTRLGIPAIMHEESLCGLAARKATIFPQSIGIASTWDPELVEKMTTIIRKQMRAVGSTQSLSPVLDLGRDPRWGRTEETYGEDPYLASSMGVAYVKGLQGDSLKKGVIATGKHFIGYSFTQGGRNWGPSQITARDLLENYARPFEAAIRVANIGSIMNSYSEIDGLPCGVSYQILTELLRNKLGFNGLVVSDYETIKFNSRLHRIVSDPTEAAILALKAGMDVELPNREGFGKQFINYAKENKINEAEIDRAVSNVLKTKFQLGLFENPYTEEHIEHIKAVYNNPENKKIARELARKSIVLLKNDKSLLPLNTNFRKIAVIGPNANSARNLFGDYTYIPQFKAELTSLSSSITREWKQEIKRVIHPEDPDAFIKRDYQIQTILEALKEVTPNEIKINYSKGCNINDEDKSGFDEAIELVKNSDIAIVAVGGKSGLTLECTSGEARDRVQLGLPGIQLDLIKALYQTGKPIVLILINGRPLSIPWEKEHIPAIIEAWLPGEEGAGAVAEVIFGKYNPGGKLPVSILRNVGQVPLYHNHKPTGNLSVWNWNYVESNTTPLFPFSFGLSYSEFSYSNLKINKREIDINGEVEISFDLTNISEFEGEEVVQLYVCDRKAHITRPVEELVGFKRVNLKPNERKTIKFLVSMDQLGFYDENMDFVVEPGIIDVFIGSIHAEYGSELLELNDLLFPKNAKLHGKFEIIGNKRKITQKKFFSVVSISNVK